MTEENKIIEADSVDVIESDDGPTAVFVKSRLPFNLPRIPFRITKKKVMCALAALIALLLVFDTAASFILCNSLLSKNGSKSFYKYAYGEDGVRINEADKKWLEENSESSFIEAENGKKLHALEVKNENVSSSYAVICHHYGESALSMGEYARHFYELGFNLVLPDLRGHGETEIKTVSMGWDDRLDLIKWCEYIIEKDKNARIVLFGVSLGGAAVSMAAGEELPENVRVAISDSSYSSVNDVLGEYLKALPLVPEFPVLSIASKICEKKMGWSFKEASAVSQAEKVELPILYIHGEDDEAVPVIQSNDIFEICEAVESEQVLIQNGTHAENIYADNETYWTEIDLFILNNIGIN